MNIIHDFIRLSRSATPIVVSNLGYVLAGTIDAAFVGKWAGTQEQAAVGAGVSIWVPLMVFFVGLITPVVNNASKALSLGDIFEINRCFSVARCLVLIVTTMLLFILVTIYISSESNRTEGLVLYLLCISAGIPAALLNRLIIFSWIAKGTTWPLFYISIINLIFNSMLTFALVSDWFLETSLGAAGCGISTALSMWLCYGTTLIFLRSSQLRIFEYIPLSKKYAKDLIDLIKIGAPTAFMAVSDAVAFGTVGVIVFVLGDKYMASFLISSNVFSILFIVPSGISIALSSFVSEDLVKKGRDLTRNLVLNGIVISVIITIILSLFIFIFKHNIATFYSNDDEVISLCVLLLSMSVCWGAFDAMQICMSGILRSYGYYYLPFLVVFIAFWIVGIPIGYILCNGFSGVIIFNPLGFIGYWYGLLISIILSAIGMSFILAMEVYSKNTVNDVSSKKLNNRRIKSVI